jgi:SnoaL-like domain
MQKQIQGERLLLVERDVERAIMAFFHSLDSSNFEYLIQAFAPDGVWHRQGKELHGHEMVREALRAREPGARTRHLVTNMLIDSVTENKAEARFYIAAFRADGDPDRPRPDKIELPRVLALYNVRLALENNKWIFVEIRSDTTFKA